MLQEQFAPVMHRLRKLIPAEVLPASSSMYFEKKGVITGKEKKEIEIIRNINQKTSSYGELEKMWKEKESNVNSTELNRESLAFLISKFEKMNSTGEKEFKLYDEQIIALLRNIKAYEDPHQKGLIEEMKMNEGKSAVVMPIWTAYLALRSPYIQVQTVNPYLVERDFEAFKKYAEVLGIADRVDKIGYRKKENKQYISYPSDNPEDPKNKILFGLWSDFIHASQFAWVEKDLFYPTKPVIIMDEIDQIVQDEAVTPAIIAKEKIKTEDFFDGLIKQYNSFVDAQWKARQDLTGKPDFDEHGIKIEHDNYMLEKPSEFILGSVRFFRNDVPSLEEKIREQKPNISREGLKQAILERLSEKIFHRVVSDKLNVELTSPLIQKKCDEFYDKEGNLNSNLPFFWWDISDFQQALVEAYFLRKGIDYKINDLRNNVIIYAKGSQNYMTGEIKPLQTSTGYSAAGKEFQDLVQIMINIKEGLKLPLEISSGSTDSIPVGEFYRVVPEKIFGFTGSVASIAERLREGYGFETTVVPPHKSSNREINWLYAGTPDSKFDKTAELLVGGDQKNSIIVVESAEEIAKLIKKLPKDSFEIKKLTHKNEKEDKDLYSWISDHGGKRKVLITAKMVGRGIDLDLDEEIKKSGTLLISLTPFGFERSFSQVTGRIGRRGEKATVYVIVSPDDSVFDTLTINGKDIFLSDDRKKLKEAFQKGDIKTIRTLVERVWEKNEEEVTSAARDQRIFYAPFTEIRGWLSSSKLKNPILMEKIRSEWSEMLEISQTIFNNWRVGGWQSMDGVSGQITDENIGKMWLNIVEGAIDNYSKLSTEHPDSADLEKPLSDFIITQFDHYSTLPEKVNAIIEKLRKALYR